MSLKARLDSKNDQRVLCGVRRCGQQIAQVEDYPDVGMRELAFSPGWKDYQGIWRLTTHASKQIKRGYSPMHRRLDMSVAAILGLGQDPTRPYGHARRGLRLVHQPSHLPATVACPKCGFVQTLDPETLRVEPRLPPFKVSGRRR